ncbi:MAG TPA: hypothetical protein VOA87_11940, partial [Thermoanaerobaculia bacterium]|nr:hypothetical protein [Thermoanaerobaculia bacterium]
MGGERRIAAALSFVVLGIVAAPLAATQVKTFRAQSQQAFLAGTLKGVSLDALGRMELSSRAERVASVGEPFLLAAANHPDGWVVGTGNAGKVLLIDRQGKVSELFAAPEPEVFALWVDPDGTVFAGTSPRGKVYRIPRKGAKAGAAEVFFDPGETYIWSLARAADGALLVATGTQGKLFRVEGKGKGKVLYDSDDTHLRALLALPGGGLLLGTAGEGLILELARDGTVRTLYDAQQPEVVALAAAPDGTRYAAVVASEASLLDLAKPPGAPPVPAAPGARKPRAAAAAEPTVTVTVEGEPPPAPGAAKAVAGPRSEVLRISPSGVVEKLWSFNDETVYSLLWQDGSLWVGTGVEGKLYRYEGSQMLLEKDLDERQIVALLPGKPGPAFATTNASALYRVTAGRERQGTYTSAPIDAGQMARFGSFRWRGEVPPGSAVRFSFRSGVSAEPDHTWSVWTAPREGEELPLAGVPLGRYVQWRAEFSAGSAGGGEAGPRL